MQFSEKLYTLRKERGLTQKQVGEALSMAPRQYQRFEKGEQKPGFDNLRHIADFYNVSWTGSWAAPSAARSGCRGDLWSPAGY